MITFHRSVFLSHARFSPRYFRTLVLFVATFAFCTSFINRRCCFSCRACVAWARTRYIYIYVHQIPFHLFGPQSAPSVLLTVHPVVDVDSRHPAPHSSILPPFNRSTHTAGDDARRTDRRRKSAHETYRMRRSKHVRDAEVSYLHSLARPSVPSCRLPSIASAPLRHRSQSVCDLRRYHAVSRRERLLPPDFTRTPRHPCPPLVADALTTTATTIKMRLQDAH